MKLRWIALLLICVLLSGCATEASEESCGITFTDAMGRTVTVSDPQRVGICSGSLAECWLLSGGEVCAVTRDAVTERKLELPNDYIDLGSLKEPSQEAILGADLDFVILMEGLPNHRAMAETLEKTGTRYAYFDVENFSDYLQLMKVFTDITGRSDLYETNAASLQPRIEAAIESGKREDAPKVLILRTSSSKVKVLDSSFMVGGMLKEFGCVNIADNENNLLSELSIEAIVKEDPDYIFISCMGDLEEGQAQLEASLTSNPIWNTLQAVQNGRVFYLEKELFHNKPNTRWGKAMKFWQNFLRSNRAICLISLLALILMIFVALCVGVVMYTPAEVLQMPDIIRFIRFPRVVAAVFAGAGLAGAGVIIQTSLGNSLAGPNIIGVNSGAGFMTLIATLVFPLVPQMQPLAAFLGALFSVMMIYLLSRRTGTSKMTILLSGVVLNSLLNAASEALCTFFPDIHMSYSAFRVGGLATVQTSVLYPAAILITILFVIVQCRANTLELLSLGDDTAFTLGVSVKKYRMLFLICAAGMAGAAVSFAGLIGFLGLIVPHGARLVVGDEIKKLFPLSVLWGSLLLLVCDTVARTAFAPFELSVGIVISIIGAPIFIRMLLRRKVR